MKYIKDVGNQLIGFIKQMYNELNEVMFVIDQNDKIIIYKYDKNGNIEIISYLNGNVVNYEYDNVDCLSKLSFGVDLMMFEYIYDNLGNV